MPFAPALDVANAVLYEGYLLFPYTASARKNRLRWQFGVIAPERYARTSGTNESADQQVEIVAQRDAAGARADVLLRFLQVEARRVEAAGDGGDGAFRPVESLECAGARFASFDEAVERELLAAVALEPGALVEMPIAFEPSLRYELLRDADGRTVGRIARERWALRGSLRLEVEALGSDGRYVKLRSLVRNASEVVPGARSEALRTSFVSTHQIVAATGARFVSALDPPSEIAGAVATLQNRQAFPVLVGARDLDERRAPLVLASPIILYDFPEVAPQTESDAFDSTEVDELLTLSVLGLSDAERAEARATDPRARAIVERAERFDAAGVERLHAGALRRIDGASRSTLYSSFVRPQRDDAEVPVFGDDPFAAVDVAALDCVYVDGVKIARGSHVRVHPKRRADVWDAFLDGKLATVRKIHQDLDDAWYVAVTIDDDPASDLHDWYGRSFFFSPDEVAPA